MGREVANPDFLVTEPLSGNGHPQELPRSEKKQHIRYTYIELMKSRLKTAYVVWTSPCYPPEPPSTSESLPSPPQWAFSPVPSSLSTAEPGSPEKKRSGKKREKKHKYLIAAHLTPYNVGGDPTVTPIQLDYHSFHLQHKISKIYIPKKTGTVHDIVVST